MSKDGSPLVSLGAIRWRIAISLTAAMMMAYLGFILLVAYAPVWLGAQIIPGLSRGIVLGVFVIVTAWLLILVYVHWANRHYDVAIAAIRRDEMSQ